MMEFYEILLNYIFLKKIDIVLKQKAANDYLLYIFVITTASIHFHGIPLNVHLLSHCFIQNVFISGVSLIYINANDC